MPDRARVEQFLVEQALKPFLDEIAAQREHEMETIAGTSRSRSAS